MSNEKPMSKAEARSFIKRAREALRDLEASIVDGSGGEDAFNAIGEVNGSMGEIEAALDESFGGRGVKGVEGF